jgi:hypothetical protein
MAKGVVARDGKLLCTGVEIECGDLIVLPVCLESLEDIKGRSVLIEAATGSDPRIEEGLYDYECSIGDQPPCSLRWFSPSAISMFQLAFDGGGTTASASMGHTGVPGVPQTCPGSFAAAGGQSLGSTTGSTFIDFACNEVAIGASQFAPQPFPGGTFQATLLS